MEITDETHWQVKLFDAKIGDRKVPFLVDKLIFDSGASLIYMPQDPYNDIIQQLTLGKSCRLDDTAGLYICKCSGMEDSSFQTLRIFVGKDNLKHWFFIKNIDFLTFNKKERECALMFKP